MKIKELPIKIIKTYQKTSNIFRTKRVCRFYPTCSNYSIAAIQKYGVLKGTIISFWRILRCNPLSEGGVDKP